MNTTSVKNTFDTCLKSALSGDKNSQYELAMMYLIGDDVTQDVKAFENWALKAYEQGHAGALYELAQYHRTSGAKMRADLTGEKFIEHIELAYKEFEILAKSGLLEAQEILGEMYRFGEMHRFDEGFGIEPNREKSMYWYGLAASNGSKRSNEILIYMSTHPNDGVL